MTDKIIIDGVDVSECLLKDGRYYYKQCQRKKEENEELRYHIKEIANLLDIDTGDEYNFGMIEEAIKELKMTQSNYENVLNQNKSLQKELLKALNQLENVEDSLYYKTKREILNDIKRRSNEKNNSN